MNRLDMELVQRGLVETRLQAKRLILAGAVKVNDTPRCKPGQRIPANAAIHVKQFPKYVSRGGLKLEKALHLFDIPVASKIAVDIGASTGGFTDCLLQHGAAHVYTIDVGYGQLAWKLRKDPRVHVRDRTNVRSLHPRTFLQRPDIATVDVSFISLHLVLPVLFKTLNVPEAIALVKPQFEAGRDQVKKGGIVDDPRIHTAILNKLMNFTQTQLATVPVGLTFSPICRDIGNIEYLLWLRKSGGSDSEPMPSAIDMASVCAVVETAHRAFYAVPDTA